MPPRIDFRLHDGNYLIIIAVSMKNIMMSQEYLRSKSYSASSFDWLDCVDYLQVLSYYFSSDFRSSRSYFSRFEMES